MKPRGTLKPVLYHCNLQTIRRHIVLLIVIAGVLLRIMSLSWNSFPHGDVIADSESATWIAREGKFFVREYDPVQEEYNLPYDPKEFGGIPMIQHPPLWSLLAAGINHISGMTPNDHNSFTAMRILSFLSGLLVLYAAFLISKRMINDRAALSVAAMLSLSWIMIDYSGNGSLYMMHAALFLSWILAVLSIHHLKKLTVTLAVICAAGYLLNYQCITLVATSLIWLMIQGKYPFGKRILHIGIFGGILLAITFPWLLRNYLLFHDPFFGHTVNLGYVVQKASIADHAGNITFVQKMDIIAFSLRHWLFQNLYFVARKLFILTPIAFVFFSYGLIEYFFNFKRLQWMLPVLIVFILHLGISVAWPVVKFRYFVPLIPLVLIIAMEYLEHLKLSEKMYNCIIIAILSSFAVLSWLTWCSVPTHTYYYDGVLTEDSFGGSAELDYIQSLGFPTPQDAHQ